MNREASNPSRHGQWATADLFDADPNQVAVCDLQFRSHGGVRAIAGPCATLRAFDHAAVRGALSEPGNGRILVVEQLAREPQVAMLGDRLALLARANGWTGVVISGAVRDSARLRFVDLGVFALFTTARRANTASSECERGISLTIGGAEFLPGRWVVADSDAVICCREQLFRGLYS